MTSDNNQDMTLMAEQLPGIKISHAVGKDLINKIPQTNNFCCTVIIPVGPGHQNIVDEAESSVQKAIRYSKGPFHDIKILKIDDRTGQKGRARARNIGIDMCLKQNYQWLFFLDADDLLCQEAFQRVSEYIEHYDAIWGSIFEMRPGQTTATIKPEQIHAIQGFEQLLLYDDPSLTLQMGHFVKTHIAARLRFNEKLRTCEEVDYFLKIWKAHKCLKVQAPLCITRRGMGSQTLAEWQRTQITASILRKYTYGLDEFLDDIPAWIHAYQTENTNHDVLEKLLNSRRRLSEHYLRLSENVFENELELTKEAYFALMGSGIRNQPLPEAEQAFITGILGQDFSHPKSLQYLLVVFLYCFPHQLPQQWRSQLSVPKWAAEYLYAWFNRGKVKAKDELQPQRWKVVDGLEIEGVPPDFELPPIVGENNDYTFLEEQRAAFVDSGKPYSLGVSIVIPVYNRKEKLAKTLAAITHQTYPEKLIEVIVADDGSSDGVEEVIDKYHNYLSLKYIHQEDRGYRLSAVRNAGMEAARYDYIALLDCDMLPVPEYIECLMQYFHITEQAVLIAHRRFVCTDALTDDQILEAINAALHLPDVMTSEEGDRPEPGEPVIDPRLKSYTHNNYLKEGTFSSFCAFYGCSVAYPKKAIQEVGPFDEDFQAWGCEDTEMGYRLYNAGYYFIPVLKAVALHQEPPGGENETDREQGKSMTQALLEQKCPAPTFRTYRANVIYDVPKVSIYMAAYNAGKYIQAAVDSALAQTYTDLEVCIVNDDSTDKTLHILEQQYANNPRVRWISQQNSGVANTFNAAVNMCRGMYLAHLDADDILLRLDAVEMMVEYLDTHNVGLVYSSCTIIDEQNQSIKTWGWPQFSREKFMVDMIVSHFRMFRKRDWARLQSGFDETVENAEDYDLFLRLSERCSFYHIPEVLYGYRWHGEKVSLVHKERQIRHHSLVIQRALHRNGLDDRWTMHVPAPQEPKKIIFQRKGLR